LALRYVTTAGDLGAEIPHALPLYRIALAFVFIRVYPRYSRANFLKTAAGILNKTANLSSGGCPVLN
jgi:hypothetical protein